MNETDKAGATEGGAGNISPNASPMRLDTGCPACGDPWSDHDRPYCVGIALDGGWYVDPDEVVSTVR